MCSIKQLDILAVVETWLHSGIGDAEVGIEGYVCLRKDRSTIEKERGGGILLYVKNSLGAILNEKGEVGICEWLTCSIGVNSKRNLNLGVFYKAFSGHDPNDFGEKQMFEAITKISNKVSVIVGDFNYPGIDWKNNISIASEQPVLNFVADCFLYQHVKEPTRGNNILDLVFSTEEGMIVNCNVGDMVSNSDHNSVWFEITGTEILNHKKLERKSIYYGKADFDKINSDVSNVHWELELGGLNSDEMWEKFKDTLFDIANRHNRRSKAKDNNNKMWFTRDVKKLGDKKQMAWQKYQGEKTFDGWERYKIARNAYTDGIRKAKMNFEQKLVGEIKHNSKPFYKYVNSNLRVKEGIGNLSLGGDEFAVLDEQKCEVLNKYFSSVFNSKDYSVFLEFEDKVGHGQGIDTIDIHENAVKNMLLHLDPNKTPGVDNMSNKLLTECANSLSKPITYLFSRFFESSTVPADWRQSNITPIYKGGGKEDANNYRPVSLTCSLCKMFETILKDNIMNFLSEYDILNGLQHGFVKNRSCLSNLLQFFDYISLNLDRHNSIDVLYLDFKKAFDKVPHQLLIYKLDKCGIRGKVLDWISTWLTGRSQRVVINGANSGWEAVKSGVPQGSVLGPLLFTIFIEDMGVNIINRILKFADDTKTFGVSNSVQNCISLQRDLDSLVEWSENWGMTFNAQKCKVMHFGSNNLEYDYNIKGENLHKVEVERDLGILVSNDFKVAKQVDKASSSANKILGMIKRTFVSKGREIIIPLYKSIVRPHLEYCIQAWRPHYKKDIEKLEAVQRRTTKIISGMEGLSYEERLKKLGLPSLEYRRIRGDLIEVFKIYKGWTNLNFHDFFTPAASNLRGHKLKLFKTRFNTDVGKFTFANRVIDMWNSLPEDLLECTTLNAFKNSIDKVLLHQRGYS